VLRTRDPEGPGEGFGASAVPKLAVEYLPFWPPEAVFPAASGRAVAHSRSRGPGRDPASEKKLLGPPRRIRWKSPSRRARRRDRSDALLGALTLRTLRPRARRSRGRRGSSDSGAPALGRTHQHPNEPTRGPDFRPNEPTSERTNTRTNQHGARTFGRTNQHPNEPTRGPGPRPNEPTQAYPRSPRRPRRARVREPRGKPARYPQDGVRAGSWPLTGEFLPVHYKRCRRRLPRGGRSSSSGRRGRSGALGPRSSSLPAGYRWRGRGAGAARVLRDVENGLLAEGRYPQDGGGAAAAAGRAPQIRSARERSAPSGPAASRRSEGRSERRAAAPRGAILCVAGFDVWRDYGGSLDAKRRARKRRYGWRGKQLLSQERLHSVRSEAERAKTQRQRVRE